MPSSGAKCTERYLTQKQKKSKQTGRQSAARESRRHVPPLHVLQTWRDTRHSRQSARSAVRLGLRDYWRVPRAAHVTSATR